MSTITRVYCILYDDLLDPVSIPKFQQAECIKFLLEMYSISLALRMKCNRDQAQENACDQAIFSIIASQTWLAMMPNSANKFKVEIVEICEE